MCDKPLGFGLDLLQDAAHRRDQPDLELALVVCATFGFTAGYLDLLIQLASEDWHFCHEDVVTGLDTLRSPQAIDALTHVAWWVPEYLDFDEHRALARNLGTGRDTGRRSRTGTDRLAGF